MITGSTSSHAMATYTASAGAASATASQGRIPQNRTQAEKAQNTDSISLSDKSSDYSKSIADNKPYFPVREGMNADALVLGVANPGAVSSSKDKTFAEVATDARKRMDEKYALMKAPGHGRGGEGREYPRGGRRHLHLHGRPAILQPGRKPDLQGPGVFGDWNDQHA